MTIYLNSEKTLSVYLSFMSSSSSDSGSDSDSDSFCTKTVRTEIKHTRLIIPTREVLSVQPVDSAPSVDYEVYSNQLEFKVQTLQDQVVQLERRLRYYVSEMSTVHEKNSILSAAFKENPINSIKQSRHSQRTSYACGSCGQRPKATACICTSRKKIKRNL